MKQLWQALLVVALSGCAITNETTLLVGATRPATKPEDVRLYVEPPAAFEVIAIVSADAAHDMMSKQALQDIAVRNIGEEAAKVGANGILLDSVGSFQVGSSGLVMLPMTAQGAPAVGFGTSNNRTGKQISGKAIFVPSAQ